MIRIKYEKCTLLNSILFIYNTAKNLHLESFSIMIFCKVILWSENVNEILMKIDQYKSLFCIFTTENRSKKFNYQRRVFRGMTILVNRLNLVSKSHQLLHTFYDNGVIGINTIIDFVLIFSLFMDYYFSDSFRVY